MAKINKLFFLTLFLFCGFNWLMSMNTPQILTRGQEKTIKIFDIFEDLMPQAFIDSLRTELVQGANPNTYLGDKTPLTFIITTSLLDTESKLTLINLLLEFGADVNKPDRTDTPLTALIKLSKDELNQLDYEAVINQFVEHGATLNTCYQLYGYHPHQSIAIDRFSLPPLVTAAYRGNAAVAKFLLELGADVNVHSMNYFQETPLIAATLKGSLTTMHVLLSSTEIEVNATDSGNANALYFACQHYWQSASVYNASMVILLLNHGAICPESSPYYAFCSAAIEDINTKRAISNQT